MQTSSCYFLILLLIICLVESSKVNLPLIYYSTSACHPITNKLKKICGQGFELAWQISYQTKSIEKTTVVVNTSETKCRSECFHDSECIAVTTNAKLNQCWKHKEVEPTTTDINSELELLSCCEKSKIESLPVLVHGSISSVGCELLSTNNPVNTMKCLNNRVLTFLVFPGKKMKSVVVQNSKNDILKCQKQCLNSSRNNCRAFGGNMDQCVNYEISDLLDDPNGDLYQIACCDKRTLTMKSIIKTTAIVTKENVENKNCQLILDKNISCKNAQWVLYKQIFDSDGVYYEVTNIKNESDCQNHCNEEISCISYVWDSFNQDKKCLLKFKSSHKTFHSHRSTHVLVCCPSDTINEVDDDKYKYNNRKLLANKNVQLLSRKITDENPTTNNDLKNSFGHRYFVLFFGIVAVMTMVIIIYFLITDKSSQVERTRTMSDFTTGTAGTTATSNVTTGLNSSLSESNSQEMPFDDDFDNLKAK